MYSDAEMCSFAVFFLRGRGRIHEAFLRTCSLLYSHQEASLNLWHVKAECAFTTRVHDSFVDSSWRHTQTYQMCFSRDFTPAPLCTSMVKPWNPCRMQLCSEWLQVWREWLKLLPKLVALLCLKLMIKTTRSS